MFTPTELVPPHCAAAPGEVAGFRCQGMPLHAVSPVAYLMPPLEDAVPHPPPAEPMLEDIGGLQRIVGSADRLAGLSARLHYARPPHRWGDFTDVPREQAWRARMNALHGMGTDGRSRSAASD
jgi:hypothetical protein